LAQSFFFPGSETGQTVLHRIVLILLFILLFSVPGKTQITGYLLAPDDRIFVTVQDLEEFKPEKISRIDSLGNIQLPLLGTVHVAGFTVEQVTGLVRDRLKRILIAPEVNVTLAEFRNQPVSIYGEVEHPGVQQIHGRLSLVEVLSLAGGISPNAANVVKITRPKATGTLPLPAVTSDATGEFWIGEVDLASLLQAKTPASNIDLLPQDVVTVPKADIVYVVGAVRKAGGFMLNERQNVTVLQALALSEGTEKFAATTRARILRQKPGTSNRDQILVNLKALLSGKSPDQSLLPGDVLYVPPSGAKELAYQSAEVAAAMLTGVVIYRVGYSYGTAAGATAVTVANGK
jgi:polysaccharide export outer membrane protein